MNSCQLIFCEYKYNIEKFDLFKKIYKYTKKYAISIFPFVYVYICICILEFCVCIYTYTYTYTFENSDIVPLYLPPTINTKRMDNLNMQIVIRHFASHVLKSIRVQMHVCFVQNCNSLTQERYITN